MIEAGRYALAALACGLIAVFASENLFWVLPHEGLTVADWVMTWIIAYCLPSACALSAVAWSGCGGWRALFLGGAILGFMVEGVVVDTMYDAFPAQLVWTPLAWHALVTALWLGGAQRMGGPAAVWLQVAAGVAIGGFALYWPLEETIPPAGAVLVYLLGIGLVTPLGHLVLDRLGRVPRPHGAVLLIVPGLAALFWAGKLIAAPNPVKLALPVMVGLTVWAMVRLGDRWPVSLGAPRSVAFRMSALLVPAIVAAIAIPGWQAWGGVEGNIPFALATGLASLCLWLWLMWQAARVRRAP